MRALRTKHRFFANTPAFVPDNGEPYEIVAKRRDGTAISFGYTAAQDGGELVALIRHNPMLSNIEVRPRQTQIHVVPGLA